MNRIDFKIVAAWIWIFPIVSYGQAMVGGRAARDSVISTLDRWHQAAAQANFQEYFGLMSPDAYFLGTDASENWDLASFKEYSRPHFERGRAWSFTPVERNVYLSQDGQLAWFDELLDTRMGLCRGSGVLKKSADRWLIAHYVLSITVPNEQVGGLIELKKEHDSLQTIELSGKYRRAVIYPK